MRRTGLDPPRWYGRVLALARAQHGVVCRRQLVGLGIADSSIQRAITSMRLLPVYPGVYGLGTDVLSQRGRWMAGVLAGGAGSVLSHLSAGQLWGIAEEGPRVEVTRRIAQVKVAGLAPGCAYPGLWIRRTRSLGPHEMTSAFGIAVMTVERTLLSMAATSHPARLRFALAEADRKEILDRHALAARLERAPGVRGVGLLRELAQALAPVHPSSRSTLEDEFIFRLEEEGLPAPEVNSVVEGLEVDLCWPLARVVVELDGFGFHGDRLAFERDRRRDARLVSAGYKVVRFTYRRVFERPGECLETVRGLLSSSR